MDGITFNFDGNLGQFIICIRKTFFSSLKFFDGQVLELLL